MFDQAQKAKWHMGCNLLFSLYFDSLTLLLEREQQWCARCVMHQYKYEVLSPSLENM